MAAATALVGIVVVSHSARLAEGVVELAAQMAGDAVAIIPVGGGPDGSLGTDADRISRAIVDADRGAGVVVIGDLGSAILATDAALESLGPEATGKVRVSAGPLVEGAVVAAVQASIGQTVDEVVAAANGAHNLDKGVSR
jgi:phosphoenolpyruvate---glycerone phosphotransferase subunit DhaM